MIGQLSDAVDRMVFGFRMVGTSFVLRRIVGEEAVTEREEAVIKEGI